MKAIQKKIFSKGLIMQIATFVLLGSCQKDGALNSLDVQNINSEAASSAMVSENLEITTKAIGGLTNTQYAGARMQTDTLTNLSLKDDRLACALVTLDRTGTKDSPAGTITLDYGDGGTICTDARGIQRTGKIIIAYTGQRWAVGSTLKVMLKDYYRNGNRISATEYDTLKSVSGDSLQFKFSSVLDSGQVTFADGKSVTRYHSFTRVLYRFINSATGLVSPSNDEWHVTGSAGGKCKDGDTYTVAIGMNNPLVNKVSCLLSSRILIPVKGSKTITVGTSSNYYIDYGTGTCDDLIIVTFNNSKKTISVQNDGN